MNFRPDHGKRSRRPLRLNLASMIDVIFLLLIFFLVSTSYTPPESDLAPALQAERVASGRGADLQPQVVEVRLVGDRPGFVLGERATTDRDELVGWLERLPKEGGVFVKASSGLTVEWAARALQAARDAGFLRVTYVPMP